MQSFRPSSKTLNTPLAVDTVSLIDFRKYPSRISGSLTGFTATTAGPLKIKKG